MGTVPRPILERFLEKIEVSSSGCWLWTAYVANGYGRLSVRRSVSRQAHLWAYEWFVGEVPDGLQLDHLCRVRRCVNPMHVEPVTAFENQRRGQTLTAQNLAKTHCRYGHPYEGSNLRITVRNRGHRRSQRFCRACARRTANERHWKEKVA